jgi:hypothetical protein
MRINKTTVSLIVFILVLSACAGKNIYIEKINASINVFGVKLQSNKDYKTINGVVATEEPCLKGYERSFDALDIIIGYGFDKKIRKITTLNHNTGMFGVSPGMTFDEGRQKILSGGFAEYSPPYVFISNGYTLTTLVNSDKKIFGLTIQRVD